MSSQSSGNIIFITNLHLWSLEAGKGGKAFFHTVSGYLNSGWNITLITTGGNVPDDLKNKINVIEDSFPKVSEIVEGKSRLLSIGARFFRMYLQYNFYVKNARKILNQNRKLKHIIYAYEVEAVRAAKAISKEYDMPLVTRFQGTILANTPDDFFTGIRSSPHFSALRTKADFIVMTNDGTQGLSTLKRLGNTSTNIAFWRNGVDKVDIQKLPERNQIRKDLNLNNNFIFITVSRLVNWKRVYLAIEGLASIKHEHPEARLIIVGDGPEKDPLEQLAKDLNVSDIITFAGAIEQSKVTEYLHAADAFLSFYDLSNLGNPIMEAMVTGKPIITIDVGDTKELIVNDYNGILLSASELSLIPEMMSKLIKDSQLRDHLIQGAIESAKKEFWSWTERMDAEIKCSNALL